MYALNYHCVYLERLNCERNIILFLFLIILLSVIGAIKKKHPEKWKKYDTTSKIIWTALSIILMGFMGYSAWYMFAKSNAGTETKIFNILATLGLILFFVVLTVSTWKKKNKVLAKFRFS